ncbi:energy-coupling factor ABC transporter permease [Haloimpatiens sp. FM7330]|uniref:energy-coupling factor ABC transporter permease n=1 Tax=Haloimpatiens sp. FM7330 TaxID=3298610 RepID=UPI00363E6A6C
MTNNKKLKIFLVALILMLTPSTVQAMHIMEGFLPAKWCIFWFAVSIPFVIKGMINLSKVFKEQPKKKILIGLAGGFVFVLSALKIPSVTGSCSHPTGVGLGAIIFGPTIMTVLGIIVLIFQALLLAHGGITTLGANTFSMAVAGPLVSYFIFRFLKKKKVKISTCVFLAAALGDLATYTVTSFQLAIAFPDPIGGMMASATKFLSIFALTQIPLAIAEGLLTTIIYNLLSEYKKEGVLSDENIH